MIVQNIFLAPRKLIGRARRWWRRRQYRRTMIPIDMKHPHKQGVLFIGYAEGALGLGQSFRSDLEAAAAADLQFSVYPFRRNIEQRLLAPFMPERYDQSHIYDINVIEVATDQLVHVEEVLNPALLSGNYNILRTYWELAEAPEAWRPFLSDIHEIWAPNTFVAKSFSQIFNGPIKIIPPMVSVEGAESYDRTAFGMEEGRFYFMFSFDYHSSAHRKNPSGVLKAFRLAFPRGDENVGLVIKSNGPPELCQSFVDTLRAVMAEDSRILVISDHFSRGKMLGLIQACDAYVSLHRAEGFGLGMAEAMSLGRVVIGTGYSGNSDFLTEETGYPVPYEMIPVAAHEYNYAQGLQWAEPDVDVAAHYMREGTIDRASTSSKAKNGQRLMQEYYNANAIGAAMKTRVTELMDTLEQKKELQRSS